VRYAAESGTAALAVVLTSVEHRAAASITALSLQLVVDGDAVALATLDRGGAEPAASADCDAGRSHGRAKDRPHSPSTRS
jgi:hypothetical protein